MSLGWNTSGSGGGSSVFVPDTSAHWETQPTTIVEALNNLASRAPRARTNQSISYSSGVTFVLWSYTLAEGEVIGVQYNANGGSVSGGATLRSYTSFYFGASRSVGGAAAVTSGSGQEIGTLAGGTISVAASGNAVQLKMVYTATGTLYFNDYAYFDTKAVPQS